MNINRNNKNKKEEKELFIRKYLLKEELKNIKAERRELRLLLQKLN